MIMASRLADGRYRLKFVLPPYPFKQAGEYLESMAGVEWTDDPIGGGRIVKADDLSKLKHVEKMYGVVTGPSSCGCEPAGFRWVTASEVEAGRTTEKRCGLCTYRDPTSAYYRRVMGRHQCDIIDVCGEADVAEAVYIAEFSGKLEAMR